MSISSPLNCSRRLIVSSAWSTSLFFGGVKAVASTGLSSLTSSVSTCLLCKTSAQISYHLIIHGLIPEALGPLLTTTSF